MAEGEEEDHDLRILRMNGRGMLAGHNHRTRRLPFLLTSSATATIWVFPYPPNFINHTHLHSSTRGCCSIRGRGQDSSHKEEEGGINKQVQRKERERDARRQAENTKFNAGTDGG